MKVFFSDLITGGETQVFERRDVTEDTIFVCSDTPAGVRQVSGVVLDGRGGKLPFDLTVEITETPSVDAGWRRPLKRSRTSPAFRWKYLRCDIDPAGLNPAQTAEGTTFNSAVIGPMFYCRSRCQRVLTPTVTQFDFA